MLRKYPVPQTGLSLYYARKGTGLTLDMEYSSFFIVLIYFPAKLTKVCRYKDFYLFICPSANIIVRAKALKTQQIVRLLPLQGALLLAIIPRAMPWAMSFWAFSPFLNRMREFSQLRLTWMVGRTYLKLRPDVAFATS